VNAHSVTNAAWHATELDRYFHLWLERLGVDDARYTELAALA